MASHSSPSPSVTPPASKRPCTAAEEDHLESSVSKAAAAAAAPSPAGFIFMCSGATKPDCYRQRVLGLPQGRLDAVSRIKRGAALFLYDIDIKHLHGPYRAESDGGLDLVPAAFHGRFPAQVKFKIEGDFMPLHEGSLRSAIKENYFKGKFSPELNSTHVEKLRALFEPITLLSDSVPPHYVDNRPHARTAYLPASASHPAQQAAYAHHPTAYVPPSAHMVPPGSCAPPYLAPPISQPTMCSYSVTTTGYGYQAGYDVYGPMPSTYQSAQVPPGGSLYAQYSMAEHVSAPVYSNGSYYAAYQNDPYQVGNSTSHYQQSTYENDRAAYGAGHGMITTNLQLVRRYGVTPTDATEGTTHISNAVRATAYTDAAPATSTFPQSVYVAAAAPSYTHQ